MLKLAGHEWNEGKIILTSLTRSCHMQNDTIYTRLPIKRALLEMILFELERVFEGQFYLECLFKALYSLAYYGLMQIGELTQTGGPANHTVKACDVHIGTNKNKILLMLYTSKTHGKESKLQQIKICDTNKYDPSTQNFCPFKILRTYINMRGSYATINETFLHFCRWYRSEGAQLQKHFKMHN